MYLHGAEHDDCEWCPNFVADTGRGEITVPIKYVRWDRVEEVFVHEGAHISIDTMWTGPHGNEKFEAYEKAQELDGRIISAYASKDVRNGVEDVAEHYSAWFASTYKPDNLPANKKLFFDDMDYTFRHRFALFEELSCEPGLMHPLPDC